MVYLVMHGMFSTLLCWLKESKMADYNHWIFLCLFYCPRHATSGFLSATFMLQLPSWYILEFGQLKRNCSCAAYPSTSVIARSGSSAPDCCLGWDRHYQATASHGGCGEIIQKLWQIHSKTVTQSRFLCVVVQTHGVTDCYRECSRSACMQRKAMVHNGLSRRTYLFKLQHGSARGAGLRETAKGKGLPIGSGAELY